MTQSTETDERRPIVVRIYPDKPLGEAIIRLAQQGRRPYQRQVDLLLEKGIEALTTEDLPKEEAQ